MLHKSLQKYLDSIAEQIRTLDAVHIEKYEEEILTSNRCNVRIRILFVAGYLLEINEAVYIADNEVKHLNYRYHFQDEASALIFRYDNSSHYPDVPSFPDHKHTKSGVIQSEKPSVADVINEIKDFLE